MTDTKNTVVAGTSLRHQVCDLMRLAEKLDDQKPYLVLVASGDPLILWHNEPVTAEYASRFFEASAGAVTSIKQIDLRVLSGALPRGL